MKKLLILGAASLSILATSCKKDKEVTPKDNLTSGKWNHSYYAEDVNDNGKIDDSEKDITTIAQSYIIFNEDGTLLSVEQETTSSAIDSTNGTYSLSEDGKKLTVTAAGFTSVADVEMLTNSEFMFSIPKGETVNKQWNYLTR